MADRSRAGQRILGSVGHEQGNWETGRGFHIERASSRMPGRPSKAAAILAKRAQRNNGARCSTTAHHSEFKITDWCCFGPAGSGGYPDYHRSFDLGMNGG